MRISAALIGAIATTILLSACGHMPGGKPNSAYTQSDTGANVSIGRHSKGETAQAGIGVNSYLWRASLDTLAFMPLASADPFGGVVITDWYANPEKPDERFKATVYILDTRLRADALKVAMFRQVRLTTGWSDVNVNPQTEIDIENAILARARQIKLSGIAAPRS